MQWADAADGGGVGGQCDVNIPSLSRSKAVASDYRHSTGVDFEPNEHAANGVTAGQARHNSSNVGGVFPNAGSFHVKSTDFWPFFHGPPPILLKFGTLVGIV